MHTFEEAVLDEEIDVNHLVEGHHVGLQSLDDGAGLARAMEEAYRALWDAWRVGMTLAVAAE